MALDNWSFATSGPCYGANKYAESEDSGKVVLNEENSYAQIVYQTDYDQRLAFMNDVLGYTTYGNAFVLQRVLPQMHPEIPNFFAHSAEADPKGAATTTTVNGNANVGKWFLSRITVDFRYPPYNIISDTNLGTITLGGNVYPDEKQRYTSRQYNHVMEYITVRGLMKFYNDPIGTDKDGNTVYRPLDDAPGGVSVFLEKEMVWHQVPAKTLLTVDCSDNSNTLSTTGAGQTQYNGQLIDMTPPNQDIALSLGGKINTTCFDGHAPGTCLFVGYFPKFVRPNVANGLPYWNIVYRFLIRDNGAAGAGGPAGEIAGCNYIYNTFLSRWNLITSDGTATGGRIYGTGELNNLFIIQ